jgi:O-antigen ligase
MNQATSLLRWNRTRALGAALGSALAVAVGTLVALSGSSIDITAGLAVVCAYFVFAAVSLREPSIFAAVFLLVLEVLPPFYFSQLGETPVYLSFFLLPIALAIIIARFPDLLFPWDPVAKGLVVFLGATALSIPFALWLSGVQVAIDSLSRWLLLSHAGLVYYLIRGAGRMHASGTERGMFRLLLIGSVVSAAYGILDFVWPVPISHPSADQFIWLNSSILRRAQGVFYESSNFANFCGFFLVPVSTALLTHRERYLRLPRSLLLLFVSVLGLAILVGFSRSTWASVLVAVFISIVLCRIKVGRGLLVFLGLAVPLFLLWTFSPELWDYLLSARVGRLGDIFTDPNVATSGRFDTWLRVLSIMRDHPQYLIFGIGYKTLPVTRLFHEEIITDNGYLSLLLETGIFGLAGFLILSRAILTTFSKLARSTAEVPAFWSAVLFSAWCGELVLLVAADAYTYWRNIAVLTALMALTMNLVERAESEQ